MNETFVGNDGTIWTIDESGNVVDFVTPDEYNAGTSAGVTDWQSLLTAVGGAVSAWQLNQINIGRAQKGLPPINSAAYGPQVGVGLNAQTTQLIMYVALGLGAIMLLKRG